uniref:Uncharacterized protein AlNc14C100G6004 n=1 Tax=Albugo laibachii Nc14 TaxID=890382 RepID=F0WHE1_9STRA|nr:conserved hypothetical protein [Albugo laibachii Nc14]|eukprot:CCA20660.1 conserved hypothetical protein [Albugo laibachii Nc14]
MFQHRQMSVSIVWFLAQIASLVSSLYPPSLPVPCIGALSKGQDASEKSLGAQLNRTRKSSHLFSHCDAAAPRTYFPTFDPSANTNVSVKAKRGEIQRDIMEKGRDEGKDMLIIRRYMDDLYDPRLDAIGSEMTVEDVADWITYSVQLPQYAEIARKHSISGGTFPLLIENHGARLSSIGILNEIHRVQLLRFLRLRYAGLGKKPHDVSNFTCNVSPIIYCSTKNEEGDCAYRRVHTSWFPSAQNVSRTFQLQRRNVRGPWALVFSGFDTEYVEFIDTKNEPVFYQVTTWNAYGRSSRVFTHCRALLTKNLPNLYVNITKPSLRDNLHNILPGLTQSCLKGYRGSSISKIKGNVFCSLHQYRDSHCWLNETIILIMLALFLIRCYVCGDADFVLRVSRRLPPNISTQVVVETSTDKVEDVRGSQESLLNASALVTWKNPVDNGVPIVFYEICWTRLKTRETMCVRVRSPLCSAAVRVDHLRRGETYNIMVEATNSFGLTSRSTHSTYLVPKLDSRKNFSQLDLSVSRSISPNNACKKQCYLCFKELRCSKSSLKSDQMSSQRAVMWFSAKEKRSNFFSTESTSLPSIPQNEPHSSKIVRCFPHCCPAHRTRSYCGAPLFVEVTWVENVQVEAEEEKVSEDQFARFDKLIVYGRFEEHVDEDENGSFVQHEEVQQLLQVSMANRGTNVATEQCIWVEGRLVMSRMNYRLFSLNDGALCHWEYDWKSGNRQRIRGTDHHFRAYVFSRIDNNECTPIASVTSTPFTFSSYRKTLDHEQYESQLDLLNQRRSWNRSDFPDITEHNRDTPIQLIHRASPQTVQESSRQLSLSLLAASNSFCVQQSANFAILHLFMTRAQIPWSSILFKDERFLWQFLLRKQKGQIEQKQSHAERYMSQWLKLLSPSSLMDATQSMQLYPVSLEDYEKLPYQQQVYALALTCWELLCYLLAPEHWETIHAFLRSNPSYLSYEFYTCRMHATFIELLATFCSQVLHDTCSIFCVTDVLANEVVSIILRDSEHRIFSPFAKKEIRSLLQNTSILGIAQFTSQLHHICASLHLQQQHSYELGTQRKRYWIVGNWIWQECQILKKCDSRKQPRSTSTHQLGFLDIILMIQHAYGFEIRHELEGEISTLFMRSVTTLFHDSWSLLILDGKPRTLKVFPDGITTSIYSLGEGVLYGDYVGSGTGDLTALDSHIELLLYIYRWGGPSIQLRLQLTPIPVNDQGHDALADKLMMTVVVNLSSSHIEMQKCSFQQLDPEQRRKSIARWDPIYELRLEYQHFDQV